MGTTEPKATFFGSLVNLRLVERALLILILLVAGAAPAGQVDDAAGAFVARTLKAWCDAHPGDRGNLQAVVVDVRFRGEPPFFAPGDGVVVAPLAVDLPGVQHVLDLASHPESLRTLRAEGNTAVAWEYAGRAHRDLRFTGMALVERKPPAEASLADGETDASLAPEIRPDALAKAADLEEHDLQQCADFSRWATTTAGSGAAHEKVLRLVQAVAPREEPKQNEREDLCLSLRKGRWAAHLAQVAVVMGAREAGVPAFGFIPVSSQLEFLVGTYTDRDGWILVDVDHPERGFFAGGPPLLTKVPLMGGFPLAVHDFWFPQGVAYQAGPQGPTPFSFTFWGPGPHPESPGGLTDTTEARAIPLVGACG
jgi:hypothetical protein